MRQHACSSRFSRSSFRELLYLVSVPVAALQFISAVNELRADFGLSPINS